VKIWGIILLLAGVGLALISYILPVSVSTSSDPYLSTGSVINIGKLQTQMLVFHSGVALFLAGAIFTAAGELAERIGAMATQFPASSGVDERTASSMVFGGEAAASASHEDPVEPTAEELAQQVEHRARENKADLIMFFLFGGVMLVVLVLAIRGSGIGS